MSKELLFSVTKNDFEMQVFRAGGKGGQKQNKTSSGVRLIHKESGARGESREERSQIQNKKNAFKRCIETGTFKLWLRQKTSITMKSIGDVQKKIDDAMQPENIKFEIRKEGKWIESKLYNGMGTGS